MQPQPNFSGSGDQSGAIVCTQCGAPMPKEMRFCRSCGNRLGEGPAEYTETVRLPHATATAGVNAQFAGQYSPGMTAPMTRQTGGGYPRRRRLGFTGMTWMWIVLGIFFATGGGLSMFVKNVGHIGRPSAPAAANRSYVGVDEFTTGDGGVTFDVVEPPGGPADLAGLVGGDIITSFDGQAVKDDDEITELLGQTPPGKTVEVIYLRDGELKKTQMTTITRDAFNQLERAFADRPEGVGRLGFDTDDAERVAVPGTKISGVRLDNFNSSGPAALAGIQKGDIITALDKVPIRTVDELVSRVHRALPYTVVKMVVIRGTEQLEIPVKLGK